MGSLLQKMNSILNTKLLKHGEFVCVHAYMCNVRLGIHDTCKYWSLCTQNGWGENIVQYGSILACQQKKLHANRFQFSILHSTRNMFET